MIRSIIRFILKPSLMTATSKQIWLVVVSSLISTSVWATSTLVIPEDINLLAINMEKPSTQGSLFSDSQTIELPDGTNQIVFTYQPSFESHEQLQTVNGDVIIAKFKVRDDKLIFELPKFKSEREAQREITPLKWQLVNKDKQYIDIVEDTLISKGMQLGRNYPEEAKNYNIAGGIASVPVTYVTTNQFNHSVLSKKQQAILTKQGIDAQAAGVADQYLSIDQLKALYQQAPKKDQQAFQQWLQTQSH